MGTHIKVRKTILSVRCSLLKKLCRHAWFLLLEVRQINRIELWSAITANDFFSIIPEGMSQHLFLSSEEHRNTAYPRGMHIFKTASVVVCRFCKSTSARLQATDIWWSISFSKKKRKNAFGSCILTMQLCTSIVVSLSVIRQTNQTVYVTNSKRQKKEKDNTINTKWTKCSGHQ